MQEIFITIILSLVQGVLEFLPVSSSAHLSITSSMLKLGEYKNIKFFLESATFLVVLFYFRSLLLGSLVGIFSQSSRKESCFLFLKLGLPCIPFAIAFLFLHNLIENVSFFLILGSVLMVLTEIKFKIQMVIWLLLLLIHFSRQTLNWQKAIQIPFGCKRLKIQMKIRLI
jgi:undecaprenyl-diphosphatase